MRDALVASLTLDTFNRHADKVVMANVAQLVNCLHSLFLADGDKFALTPTYHVFDMFTPHIGAKAVRLMVSAPEVSFDRNGKPADLWGLNGSASLSGKQLTLTVTNPHLTQTRETEIAIRGARVLSAKARVLAETDVHAHNTFANPRAVEPRNETVKINTETVAFRFAPASVTQLQLTLQ